MSPWIDQHPSSLPNPSPRTHDSQVRAYVWQVVWPYSRQFVATSSHDGPRTLHHGLSIDTIRLESGVTVTKLHLREHLRRKAKPDPVVLSRACWLAAAARFSGFHGVSSTTTQKRCCPVPSARAYRLGRMRQDIPHDDGDHQFPVRVRSTSRRRDGAYETGNLVTCCHPMFQRD